MLHLIKITYLVTFYMLCCNQYVATSKAFVFVNIRPALVHFAGLMMHVKRCSSVCSSPYSQVSSSSFKPQFNMLALVLVTPTLNLFKVFHRGHGKCPPNGSCCVGWISYSGWSSSCYLCSLTFCGGLCNFFAVCMKLLRDLSIVLKFDDLVGITNNLYTFFLQIKLSFIVVVI